MARSLLAPTAFVTLLGFAPGCFRAAAPPDAAMSDATMSDAPVVSPAPSPTDLVAYASTRSGNARAPSYDDAMIRSKAPDDAPVAVTLVLEAALQLPPTDTE